MSQDKDRQDQSRKDGQTDLQHPTNEKGQGGYNEKKPEQGGHGQGGQGQGGQGQKDAHKDNKKTTQ